MSDRGLRLAMATLALATTAIAGYLLYAHYSGGSVVCSTGGCAAVEDSRYAQIFGVPVALLGLLGSLAILVTLLRANLAARAAGLALALSGFAFAAYLVGIQLAVLNAVCEWCVANDALVAVLAVLAVLRARLDVKATAEPR